MRERRLLAPLAALLLAAGLGTLLVVALRQPLAGGDYLAVWGLKSRALFRSGELSSLFRVDPAGLASHPEYPPLWPLLLASLSKLLGRFDELWLGLLRPALAALGSLAVYRATRAGRPYRLLAAAVFSLLPFFRVPLYTGYAEPLLLVFLLGALAESDRPEEDRRAQLRLALFLALAASTKQEGVAVAAVAAVVLGLCGRTRGAVAAALGGAAGALPWALYRHLHDTARPLADFAFTRFDPVRLLAALGALLREALVPGIGWLAGGTLLLLLAPETLHRRRALLAATGVYSLALLLSFGFSILDPSWHVRWTWDRLALVPLALLLPVLAEAFEESVKPQEVPAGPLSSSA